MKITRDRLQVRRNLDLLATIEESGATGKRSPKSFGNIIELGTRALILETNREFEVGVSLILRVVFPGQPRGDDPFARLHCRVRKAHDHPKLHYDLMIAEMDAATRDRLNIYLAQSRSGREA